MPLVQDVNLQLKSGHSYIHMGMWFGMARCGTVRYGVVWCGKVWYVVVWLGSVRLGRVWYGYFQIM
jgi:hypothetical protein